MRKVATTVDPNVKCKKVYPIGNTKDLKDLKTVGIKLTKDQALHMAQLLITVARTAEEVDITGFRKMIKKDGTYQVTITSLCKD